MYEGKNMGACTVPEVEERSWQKKQPSEVGVECGGCAPPKSQSKYHFVHFAA